MSSQLASLAYLLLIAYLFRRDVRQKPNITAALWLPTIWLFINGTRFVSQWFSTFGINIGGTTYEEGSPVDALFFGGMTLLGAQVLVRRRVTVGEFVRQNHWIAFYIIFCLLACLWSDFTFVALKRWTKLVGQTVMVLVVLTEPDPREAMARMFKRCAYVIVPISILFIKYFPDWGRGFDAWTGGVMNGGITLNKNILGFDCMFLGYFFIWHFLDVWRAEKSRARRDELIFCGVFLAAIFWLMQMAHSSTALFCLLLAAAITFCMGFKFVRKEAVTFYLVTIIVIGVVAEFGFHASALIIEALGRNTTLTGRTDLWHVLMNWDVNPVLGTGFESFWLGERRERLWELFPMLFLNSAHNGYLETYLNLGVVGLLVTLGTVLATYGKACRELFRDFHFAKFRLSYLIIFLNYNWTEVGFRTHSIPFFLFLLVAIDYSFGGVAAAWNPLAAKTPPDVADYEF